MASLEEEQKFQAILKLLRRDASGLDVFLGSWLPEWFGKAVSELALVLDDDLETIAFVDGAALDEAQQHGAGPHTVRILVFTKDEVVDVQGSVDPEKNESHTTTVRSRAGLARLSVSADGSATDSDFEAQAAWPGHVAVRLDYADGTSFSLPLRKNMNFTARLREHLPELKADLHR